MPTTPGASAYVSYASIGLTVLLGFSCHKPVTQVANPPASAPAAVAEKPTLDYFNAEPTAITAGQNSSLRWSVNNATKLEIEPDIGLSSSSGQRDISPAQTTTYTLTASNAAGSIEASVTVSLSRPLPAASENEAGDGGVSMVNGRLSDVHFDYNEENIKNEERPLLEADASLLQNLFQLDPAARVTVEGHCDERGSDEYNMALGDRRASAVKDALVNLGVPGDRLDIISYGKERPVCNSATEECYARNRRAHFSASHGRRTHDATAQP
jgi:peptidoglycan-associated lipoprotein